MGWGDDVYDVYIGVMYQIPEVGVCPGGLVELALGLFQATLQMLRVYVTYGSEPVLPVAAEVQRVAAHASYSYDSLGELIAWGDVFPTTEHVTRDDGEQTGHAGCL